MINTGHGGAAAVLAAQQIAFARGLIDEPPGPSASRVRSAKHARVVSVFPNGNSAANWHLPGAPHCRHAPLSPNLYLNTE